jgi:hypothetical protein
VEPPTAAPPPPAPVPASPAEELRCQRCGAPHDAYQEYCLECGARLAPRVARTASVWRRQTWTRDSPIWFWVPFLALLLVALVAAAIVLAATRDDSPEPEARRDTGTPATSIIGVPPGTTETFVPTDTLPATGTTGTTTVPTLPTGTDGVTPVPPPSPPPAGTGSVMAWPANQSGYTVILASIEEARGRAPADAKAREAIADGLGEVGVLNSSDYSSLNSGYWVVFTGIHDTEAEARTALATVRQSGYPIAYIREVTP